MACLQMTHGWIPSKISPAHTLHRDGRDISDEDAGHASTSILLL